MSVGEDDGATRAYGEDDVARLFLVLRQLLLLVWVTLGERKWSTLAKRRDANPHPPFPVR
jgi:hypothetical protein